MATSGVPNSGLEEFARRVFVSGAAVSLVAYINAPDSLNATSTVAADLVQPTVLNGYAPITLIPASWSPTNGIAVYSGNTQWSATGGWSAPVNGYALVYGTACLGFKDLASPFVANNGAKLRPDLLTLLTP